MLCECMLWSARAIGKQIKGSHPLCYMPDCVAVCKRWQGSTSLHSHEAAATKMKTMMTTMKQIAKMNAAWTIEQLADDQLFHFEDNWLQLWSSVPSAQHPRVSSEKNACIDSKHMHMHSHGMAFCRYCISEILRLSPSMQSTATWSLQLLIVALLLHCTQRFRSLQSLVFNWRCCAQRK